MKKITFLKNQTKIIVLLINFIGYCQTTLSAGDISITGFTSDEPDQFSFVLLTNIKANTTIKFTDNGWLQAGGFRDNEGTITWIADTDLHCGTEIIIEFTGSNTYSSTYGEATETNLGFALATNLGDQILAYQGSDESPAFVYAINFSNSGWTDATTANNSALPTGLTNGINAITLIQTDNATYNCEVTSGASLILENISNPSNWILNTNRISIGGCYYSCISCIGETVTWNGVWSGTPNLTTKVIISSDYNTENGGAEIGFSACALKIENGATLSIANSTSIIVENDLTVETGCSIIVEHSGAFVQNNNFGNINYNGTIIVNKTTAYTENWNEYTYWSSPVNNATIVNGLTDSQANRRYIFNAQNFLDETKEVGNNNASSNGQDDIDDDGNDWQTVTETSIMQPGVGYASTHDESIFNTSGQNQFIYDFEGPFNNGIITVPIYRNDKELNDNNWNFIGNPYPCAIDADEFLDQNNSIDGAIYLWSHGTPLSNTANGNQSHNFSNTDYAIINKTGQTAGGEGITPDRFIPSCQGFFVGMSNSSSATLVSNNIYTTHVTLNNNMRVSGTSDNGLFFKSDKSKTNGISVDNKLWLNLTSNNGIFKQILIGYVNGATNADDGPYFDAAKHKSNNASPIIYSTLDGSDKKYGIQGKAVSSLNENEIIKIGFRTPFDNTITYKISIAQIQGDFLTNSPIFLKDNILNIIHNLSNSDYVFTSEEGEFNNRFEIIFRDKSNSDNNTITTDDIKIIDVNQHQVKFKVPDYLNILRVRLYNLLGKQLYSFKGQNAKETFNLPNLNKSIYIVKITLSNGQTLTKKALKK